VALSLGQITENLGGRLIGDPQYIIQKLSPLDTAQADALSFLSNPKYQSQLATTLAGCVIVSPAVAETADVRMALIVADAPYHLSLIHI
jgi:UDP-3-O-[3-hydroxymyristoyl] glucosamine N-acyltransferase